VRKVRGIGNMVYLVGVPSDHLNTGYPFLRAKIGVKRISGWALKVLGRASPFNHMIKKFQLPGGKR